MPSQPVHRTLLLGLALVLAGVVTGYVILERTRAQGIDADLL